MNNLLTVSPRDLRRAADLQERIQALQRELNQLLTGVAEATTPPAPGRRRMTAQGLRNIRAGVRKRWAAFKGTGGPKPRRRMSAAAKAKLAAVARSRWRKVKAAGRTAL